MSATGWKESDTRRAQQIWRDYAQQHDLSDRRGQAAGIDPATGRIWFGPSAADIFRQMSESGEKIPLFFVRVGYETYLRKGGRR